MDFRLKWITNDRNLLLDVLGHAGAVLAQPLGVDHPVEGVRGDPQGEGDVLGVAHHSHILYYVVFCNGGGVIYNAAIIIRRTYCLFPWWRPSPPRAPC